MDARMDGARDRPDKADNVATARRRRLTEIDPTRPRGAPGLRSPPALTPGWNGATGNHTGSVSEAELAPDKNSPFTGPHRQHRGPYNLMPRASRSTRRRSYKAQVGCWRPNSAAELAGRPVARDREKEGLDRVLREVPAVQRAEVIHTKSGSRRAKHRGPLDIAVIGRRAQVRTAIRAARGGHGCAVEKGEHGRDKVCGTTHAARSSLES